MKRIVSFALVVTVLVCADGCRRSSGKKEPVPVFEEKDFIFASRSSDFMKSLRPIEKIDENDDKRHKENEAKQKDDVLKEKQKRIQDVGVVGREYIEFVRKTPAKEQSHEKFKTYLRRKNREDLFKAIDGGGITVVYLSHPNHIGHVLVYQTQPEEQQNAVFEITQKGGELVFAKESVLQASLKEQELSAVLRQAWYYAKSAYVKSPDPRDAQNLEALLQIYPPSAALDQVGRRLPQYLKNPPDARSMDRFKKFLRDNASQEISKVVDEKKIRVNVRADFAKPATDLIVCHETADTNRNHLAMSSDGVRRLTDGISVANWFTDK